MLNTEEFLKSLHAYKEQRITTLTKNLETISNKILEDAKERTPVNIGTLKENSGYFVKVEGNKIIATIGFMEFYAVYVHQGTGLFALNGDGRKTPWWWKGTTEKWEGWHYTHGQKPKQFLWDAVVNNLDLIPEELKEGL